MTSENAPSTQDAFAWTDEQKAISQIAEEYSVEAEFFDRSVCTGQMVDGEIQPANATEMHVINEHARVLMRRLSIRAELLIGRQLAPGELRREVDRIERNKAKMK